MYVFVYRRTRKSAVNTEYIPSGHARPVDNHIKISSKVVAILNEGKNIPHPSPTRATLGKEKREKKL